MSQAEHTKHDRQMVLNWLIEHFPNAFFQKSKDIKPLQVGIFDEITLFYDRIENPSFSKKMLKEALSYYSSSPAYLQSQKTNQARVDLFGNEVDVVTEDQAKYAFLQYETRYVKKKEK